MASKQCNAILLSPRSTSQKNDAALLKTEDVEAQSFNSGGQVQADITVQQERQCVTGAGVNSSQRCKSKRPDEDSEKHTPGLQRCVCGASGARRQIERVACSKDAMRLDLDDVLAIQSV